MRVSDRPFRPRPAPTPDRAASGNAAVAAWAVAQMALFLYAINIGSLYFPL